MSHFTDGLNFLQVYMCVIVSFFVQKSHLGETCCLQRSSLSLVWRMLCVIRNIYSFVLGSSAILETFVKIFLKHILGYVVVIFGFLDTGLRRIL